MNGVMKKLDVVRIRIMYNARSRQVSRTHVSVTLMLCNVNLFIMRIGKLSSAFRFLGAEKSSMCFPSHNYICTIHCSIGDAADHCDAL